MGFFSSKSFGGILSGAATGFALGGGPLGAVAGGVLGGISGSGEDAAAAQQEAAMRRAGDIEGANQLRAQALQKQILGETAGFRELGREQIPFLREEAGAAPGTSPLFQQALTKGVTDIQGQLAARGLSDSSTSAQAIAGFGSQLATQDINRLTGLRQNLAGMSTLGFGQALQGEGLSAQIGQTRAQTEANIGALRGQQGGFGGTLSTLAGLGMLAKLNTPVPKVTTGAGGGGGGAGGGGLVAPFRRRGI